ncbi:MAG TPA: hypothetical protein VJS92_08345, partial [Candidatus Polarisedimenticolaceae bacterium]|nr:hypothetical protein [Candidatus Polarisedimenticolaceae bacterium]
RYDLAALLPRPGTALEGRRAVAAGQLYDAESVGRARLGTVRPNPRFDRQPALAFALGAGAEIDARLYRLRRSLNVPAAPEGLVRLRLEPEDVAALREDLADLRVVDGAGRQRPYLLERDAQATLVPLRDELSSGGRGESRHALVSASGPLRADRLLLEAEPPFFDREYQLMARLAGGGETVERGRLVRPAGDPRPVTIPLAPRSYASFELRVQDGDDAPLALRSARAHVLLPEMYVAAGAGDYTLLLGSPAESAPHYELARIRDVVLAVKSVPPVVGPLAANPDYSARARWASGGLRHQVLLWSALGAAVIVLVALTLRLARRETPAG